jgi:hypothetical protein
VRDHLLHRAPLVWSAQELNRQKHGQGSASFGVEGPGPFTDDLLDGVGR